MIHGILAKFGNIIAEIEYLNTTQIRELCYYKCKIQLIDGSNLRISEKRDGQLLIQYSYYWLDDNNNLLIGWDNTPHHPDIHTYPHHKHVHRQDRIETSKENDLSEVMEFIKQRIFG